MPQEKINVILSLICYYVERQKVGKIPGPDFQFFALQTCYQTFDYVGPPLFMVHRQIEFVAFQITKCDVDQVRSSQSWDELWSSIFASCQILHDGLERHEMDFVKFGLTSSQDKHKKSKAIKNNPN
jgi:hypothetical protein